MSKMTISVAETEGMTESQVCGTTPNSLDESSPNPIVVDCAPNTIGRFIKFQRTEEYLDLGEIDIFVNNVGKCMFLSLH